MSHRAVILTALADGESVLEGLATGEDVRRTADAMTAMGAICRLEDDPDGGLRAVVQGVGIDGLRLPAGAIDCGNSGTTMRLLTGLLAGQRFGTRLVGDRSLSRRPMARIVLPLRARGAHVAGTSSAGGAGTEADPGSSSGDEVFPPISVAPLVDGERLQGLEYEMPIASAQVKSAMLLSGLYAEGPTLLREPVISRDHTERMLMALGVPVATAGPMVVLDPDEWSRRGWDPVRWRVPGDVSSAAFFLAAAAMGPGSRLRIRGVGVNPTRTGFLETLRQAGARLQALPQGDGAGDEPVADLQVAGPPRLHRAVTGGELVVRMIDEVPAFCAAAAVATGRSEVRDAADLRHKESDRLSALKEMLDAFGVPCDDLGDGLAIEGTGGRRVRAARVHSRGDHRIAMAATVLALSADGESVVDDVDCVATSFPGFDAALRALGADVAVDTDEAPGDAGGEG